MLKNFNGILKFCCLKYVLKNEKDQGDNDQNKNCSFVTKKLLNGWVN